MKQHILKKFSAFLMASLLTLTALTGPVYAQDLVLLSTPSESTVAADWKFGEKGVLSGSLADGNLVIKDQSGNGNNLSMQLYQGKQLNTDNTTADWSKYLAFSEDTMNDSGDGSMIFKGDNSTGTGADFITTSGAAINANSFENGYTIEFLYYIPSDWTASDQWMGLMARQTDNISNVKSMDEPQLGSMSIAVSNCKEVQFLTAPSKDDKKMSSAAWSVSMDKGGVWYHIAITSDGDVIKTYVNGCEAFRDYSDVAMDGIFADAADGRFRIGSSWWKEGTQTLDKFLHGSLQEIRISKAPLDRSQWLIQNPEQYLGKFGSNSEYTLKKTENYNFVFIPDTQNTVKFKPTIMDTAIDQLIKTADKLQVKGVVHLGDIVDNNNDGTQYNNAKSVFYQLPENGIKFLAQQGNHDGWSAGISNYYNSFSKNSTLFMRRSASYLTNDSPSGNSSYMLVRAGNYNYLVISLSCSGSASGAHNNTAWDSKDEDWLKNVLNTYPKCPTIVTTHDLQNCSDTVPSSIKLSSQGNKLWNIVKDYDQVFMMVGGHSHGAGVEVLNNSTGKPVISILADYQFSYNGGNGFFKYAEFGEEDNKIYVSTYSPYAASLKENQKAFYDVNFMTGDGNYNEIEFNFAERFKGMKIESASATQGKWMSGEYHAHTNQSNDATVADSKVENVLDVAFRESGWTNIAGASNITKGTGLDYFFLADHFRKSRADADGNVYAADKMTPRYISNAQQFNKFNKLQTIGKYSGKIFYSGFEWDMPGLDHAAVGIIDNKTMEVPLDAIHKFEWLYADQNNDMDSLYENNGATELSRYGERKATTNNNQRSNVDVAYDGIRWLKENYPESYLLPNHPSRHNGGSGVVSIKNLRTMNDIAPDIVFGFEGIPGNQLSPDGTRCEVNDIFGGADVMLSQVGGVWDSMLSEGRHFYNFANSDFHFKTSGTNSSGYYPGEFSRNYTFVNPGNNNSLDYKDVVQGMRSGNSFAVYGDLIDALDFKASGSGKTAVMGSDLKAYTGDTVTLSFRFKSPDENNYVKFTEHETNVSNKVKVDHIDLIGGKITGKIDISQYDTASTTGSAIVKTFSKAEWGAPDADGYYTVNYKVPADSSKYYRLRGTNLPADTEGLTDKNGNPLKDIAYNTSAVTDFNTRVNKINDRNYTSLWFYSNPIFVYTEEKPKDNGGSTTSGNTSNSGNTSGYASNTGITDDTVSVNADGSKTTKTTDKATGTVVENTIFKDGTTKKVETRKDGTVISTTDDKKGNVAEVWKKPDGSFVTNTKYSDGTSSTVEMVSGEIIRAVVNLSNNIEKGSRLLPIPVVPFVTKGPSPVVEINIPENSTVQIVIPAKNLSNNVVPTLVYRDGKEEIVKRSAITNEGMALTLTQSGVIKLVDNTKTFIDVKANSWYSEAVGFMSSHEILQGTGSNQFSPEKFMTRAMLVVSLCKLENGSGANNATFEDVLKDKWYSTSVSWAIGKGIIKGTGKGFEPNGIITREQLITILWNNEGAPTSNAELNTFKDDGKISGYAVNALKWAVEKGILTGDDRGFLNPDGKATRAQTATILQKYIEGKY